MNIKAWLLAVAMVVDFTAIEKALVVKEQLDVIEMQTWWEFPTDKLAPLSEVRKYNQHRYCLLCAEFMDTTLVERHEKSTVFGLCETCYARKNGTGEEVVKMARPLRPAMPIKIHTVVVRCKVCKFIERTDRMDIRFAKEQWTTCQRCLIRTAGFGVKETHCPTCAKIVGIEQVDLQHDGDIKFQLCLKCEDKLNPPQLKVLPPLEAPKRLSDMDVFKGILEEWSVKPFESAI